MSQLEAASLRWWLENVTMARCVQCTSVLHSAVAETAETLINLPDPFKTHCHCNVYNYYAAHFPQGAVCQAFLKNTTGHRVSGS